MKIVVTDINGDDWSFDTDQPPDHPDTSRSLLRISDKDGLHIFVVKNLLAWRVKS